MRKRQAEWRKKKFPESAFEEKFKQLHEAEENLADEGKRVVYDQPCLKLFNLAAPTHVVFGEKDAMQCAPNTRGTQRLKNAKSHKKSTH